MRSGPGSGWPAGRGCVSEHSTNLSPMSDCGRIAHSASLLKSLKPSSVISSVTAARLSRVTSSDSTVPTFTPATFTSTLSTRNEAFMKIARTR